ncbi:MAG: hypothetical protein ABFC57_10855 [Veillonellales bacterium]
MSYTQEQLNSMTQEQLKVAILTLQGQGTPTAVESPTTVGKANTITFAQLKDLTFDQLQTMTKDDLLKLQQDAADFPAVIEQALTAKIEEEAAALGQGINNTETKVKTWVEKFREKHGVSVPVAVVVGGYIVWQVSAAAGRVLGLI